MDSKPSPLLLREATSRDVDRLEEIRAATFAPIFASFRSILGDEIYHTAQAPEDAAQGDLLVSLLAPDSPWEVYVAQLSNHIVGFVALRLDAERLIGELGLNAVEPAYAGQGIGSKMYSYALSRMKQSGMRVATVAAGADPSHAPALRAYEKAGFGTKIPSVWMCQQL